MNNNIRKSPIRFDAVILAFIMLFVGSIGSYGSVIVSDVVPSSNDSAIVDYNPTQHHFSISINQEDLELREIEEREVEEESKVSPAFSQQKNTKISTRNKCLSAQDDILFFYSQVEKVPPFSYAQDRLLKNQLFKSGFVFRLIFR
ncbi:MAG: hypothetical protein HC803_10485 [Saprospiraceae bacterium]|nr:hypothetical protein [Saprospiraceae bacterium]